MNRNNGLLAGVVVALTLYGVSNRSGQQSESASAAETKTPGSPAASPPRDSAKSAVFPPCAEIASRLRRFVPPADSSIDSWSLPASCYGPGGHVAKVKPVHTLPGVRFVVATVPDPVSTHLPLFFDRIVEAVQQAAQDDNYTYDSSWFPWDADGKEYQLLFDQRAADEIRDVQQAHPAVLLFREALHSSDNPYEGGLVVFLVAEQPTGGIRDAQFENAVDWIDKLGGFSGQRGLTILGPTFSGSLPSLQRALDRFFQSRREDHYPVVVSSGTVSSKDGPKWFDAWIGRRRPNSYFRTAMEHDSLSVERFCRYLEKQGYQGKAVAFLSEDETAFGRSAVAGCGGALDLHYPRDIATLRSAYERQFLLGSPSNSSGPSTSLRGDLSEPANGNHDSVRSYAGQLTPLAQEAVLLDIANRLNEKQIQFVVLRSTNSLDQIFLSQFLRRSYPEGRVVIDGADLLFNRGAEGRSLRGVMVLSPYPLLTAGQDWTASLLARRAQGYRTFGQDSAEAVYLVARELFFDRDLGTEVPLRDLSSPQWARAAGDDARENSLPPTWLTVIGHRRFWPLAVLNANTLRDPALRSSLPDAEDRGDGHPLDEGEDNPVPLPSSMWTFLIVYLAGTAVHCYFCWKGSIMGSPRARAYFAPIDRRQHSALVAFGCAVVAMIAAPVAAGSGLLSCLRWRENPFKDPSTAGFIFDLLLAALALAVFACLRNFGIAPLSESGSAARNTRRWRAATAVGALLAVALHGAVYYYLVCHLTAANRIPVYWRSVNLFSGVSPLLPQVLFLVGAYLWFWCNLRGLAHFGDDRPLLPALADLPHSNDGKPRMPMFSRERAADPVEIAALPLTRKYLRQLALIFLAAASLSAVALRGFWVRTLGELSFGVVIFVAVCLCISVVLADGVQMWRAWSELRQLLVYLDRLPLRRTLRAMKSLAWGSIWRISGNVLEERYRVVSLQNECLRHLDNSVAEWVPSLPSEISAKSLLLERLSVCQEKLREFAHWFVNLEKEELPRDLRCLRALQDELAAAAGLVMTNLLLPEWRKEKESLVFHPAAPRSKSEGETASEPAGAALPLHVRVAEEFFVLPYVAFIQNILGRIRTIALGSLWLFIFATLAVSSYPFDPLNVLGGIFLAVFAIVGGISVIVYSQMSRDATLSHITNTPPGELGFEFWSRILGFGIGPLLGLLTTLFPSITDFAFSWLQPGVQALK